MNKTLLVLRHELITTITRRSYLIAAFGIPLITFLIFGVISTISDGDPEAVTGLITGGPAATGTRHEGFVDLAGLFQNLPEEIPSELLQQFPDEAGAAQALADGEIDAYYIIPADYVETGEIVYVRPDFSPFSNQGDTALIQWLLKVSLLDGDAELAERVLTPFEIQSTVLNPVEQRDESNPLSYALPYGVTMFYYFMLITTSSLLLNSVTKEKENRVMEVLMATVHPRQLLTGKIIGLGLVGLLQTMLWLVSAFILLRLSGSAFDIPEAFQLPVTFLLWAVLFFVLGYAFYASLMAAAGALSPNLREASQATFVVIMPLLVPLFFINSLIEEPNGMVATLLSLFPPTAPVVMMARLSATDVPLWQILLSAVLLLLTAILVIRAVANMFRAQTLLSGQAFDFRRMFKALAGRA